jgi:hypothetical protein
MAARAVPFQALMPGKEEKVSFLKKRNKKLLHLPAAPPMAGA